MDPRAAQILQAYMAAVAAHNNLAYYAQLLKTCGVRRPRIFRDAI